jgi:two-component system response regulator PilR (NtrC family)
VDDGKIVLDVIMFELERSYVLEALRTCAGNRKAAARRLNITYRSMRYRLEKFKLLEGSH